MTPRRLPRLAAAVLGLATPRRERPYILAISKRSILQIARARGTAAARRWCWSQVARSILPLATSRTGDCMLSTIVSDVRYAARLARRSPLVALSVTAAIAGGMAAATAIVSVMEGVFFQPLPFTRPGELVALGTIVERFGRAPEVNFLDARDLRAQVSSLAAVAEYDAEPGTVRLAADTPAVSATVIAAGRDLEGVLDLHAAAGRLLAPADFADGAAPVALLTDRFWRAHFGGDPAVVGRTMQVGAERHTIVGVLPPEADRFPAGGADVWTRAHVPARLVSEPARIDRAVGDRQAARRMRRWRQPRTRCRRSPRGSRPPIRTPTATARVIARRTAGRDGRADQADDAAARAVGRDAAGRRLREHRQPAARAGARAHAGVRHPRRRRRVAADAWRGSSGPKASRSSRSPARSASRLAHPLALWLVSRYPDTLPLAADVALDARVLAIAARLHARRRAPRRLPAGARACGTRTLGAGSSRRRAKRPDPRAPPDDERLRRGAGLGVDCAAVRRDTPAPDVHQPHVHRTGIRSRRRGHDPRVDPAACRTATPRRSWHFQDRLRDAAAIAAGRDRRGARDVHPVHARLVGRRLPARRHGRSPAPRGPMAHFFMVSPEYLARHAHSGSPRAAGLSAADRAGAPPVLLVSETFAKAAFPGQDAVGRRIEWNDGTWEIVGVTGDIRHAALSDPLDADVYVPRRQVVRDNTWLLLKTSRPAAAVLAELQRAGEGHQSRTSR